MPVSESVTITSGVPSSKSLPRITTPPSARLDSEKFILYPKAAISLRIFSAVLAPSRLSIPRLGFSTPRDFAVIIPAIAFFTMASTLLLDEVPVVVASISSFPFAGVDTLPTVETPIGKL